MRARDDRPRRRRPRPRSGGARPSGRASPASAASSTSTSVAGPAAEVLLAPADEHRRTGRRGRRRPPCSVSQPGRSVERRGVTERAGVPTTHGGASVGASKSSRPASAARSARLPGRCGRHVELEVAAATGQPSTQSTGTRNVSRPRTWNPACAARPGAEQHHPPRPVGRLDEVGVAGVLDRAVGAAVAEDRVGRAAAPTVRSATGRGRSTPRGPARCRPRRSAGTTSRRARRGAAPRGTAGRCPTTSASGPSSTSPVAVVDAAPQDARAARSSGPSSCRRRPTPGRGRCRATSTRTGSDHGPAGSSAVTKKLSTAAPVGAPS